MTYPTDPTLVAALRDANAAQLREDAADYAAAADRIARTWTDFGQVVPDGIAAQVAAHRRMAGLALAVAEWNERPTRLCPIDNSWDDDGGQLPWSLRTPMTMHYTHYSTLPAALAALLEDAP